MRDVALSLAVVALWAAAVRVSAQPPVTFTNASTETGVIPFTSTSLSAAWFDFNNDGRLDIYIATSGSPDSFFRQNADGTFTNVLKEVGADEKDFLGYRVPGGFGVTGVDHGNDGDVDIFVVNNTASNSGQEPNFFLRNRGDGTFEAVAAEIGLQDLPFGSFNMVWFDFNGDGRLDGYLPNQKEFEGNGPAHLMIAQEDGTFVNGIDAAGIGSDLRGKRYATPMDYDNDGDLDLAVGLSDGMILYRNNGNGTFIDVAGAAGLDENTDKLSFAAGDYDNDGDLDLYCNLFRVGRNVLYRNNGDGTFTDVTFDAGVEGIFPPADTSDPRYIASTWADFDNDGWLDLYLTGLTLQLGLVMKNLLYHNQGDGTFEEIAEAAGVDHPRMIHAGAALGDYNADGFLDIYSISEASPALFRNNGNANHWLAVNLVGTTSNRSAIGARVILHAGGMRQIREVVANTVWGGQNSLTAHFGLGPWTTIDSLAVRWPDGLVEAFDPPESDRYVTLVEGDGHSSAVKSFHLYGE